MAQGNAGAGNAEVAAAPLPTFTRLFFPQDSSQTLQIPERFIVELDRSLRRICSIENHNGAVWSAFYETIDGKHYFARGWFRFARDNALRREALCMEHDEIDASDDDGDVSVSQDANEVANAGAP